ncbi:hypothetical protein C5167_048366, partial [Papaver somniferum]
MGVEEKKFLVFTYGTLKKGFPNHVLLEDLIKSGDAEYLGIYKSKNKYPLVCGPYKVPFLLNFPDSELWKRNGQKGFSKYSEEEAKGYIRRKDRPKN